jgi:hypothetical protein
VTRLADTLAVELAQQAWHGLDAPAAEPTVAGLRLALQALPGEVTLEDVGEWAQPVLVAIANAPNMLAYEGRLVGAIASAMIVGAKLQGCRADVRPDPAAPPSRGSLECRATARAGHGGRAAGDRRGSRRAGRAGRGRREGRLTDAATRRRVERGRDQLAPLGTVSSATRRRASPESASRSSRRVLRAQPSDRGLRVVDARAARRRPCSNTCAPRIASASCRRRRAARPRRREQLERAASSSVGRLRCASSGRPSCPEPTRAAAPRRAGRGRGRGPRPAAGQRPAAWRFRHRYMLEPGAVAVAHRVGLRDVPAGGAPDEPGEQRGLGGARGGSEPRRCAPATVADGRRAARARPGGRTAGARLAEVDAVADHLPRLRRRPGLVAVRGRRPRRR